MASKAVNVCLIGQKFMGRTHSNAYLKVDKFFRDLPAHAVMHTICGRNRGELERFAKTWSWQYAMTDWRAAVANPEIDFVDVAAPNNMHLEMAIAALEAGKHVACEKPLAGTLTDAGRCAMPQSERRGTRTSGGATVARLPLHWRINS